MKSLVAEKRPNSECEDFAEEWATQFIWECPTKFMLTRSVPIDCSIITFTEKGGP